MLQLDSLIASGRPGDRVFVRADLNVPLRQDSSDPTAPRSVADATRIRASLPTLEILRQAQFRVVLASHLGRPKASEPEFSLAPVATELSAALGGGVKFAGDHPVGPARDRALADLAPGEIALLENLRFDRGEKGNDPAFADALVEGIDAVVNDAFGTCHRAHASVVGVAERRPAFAGRLVVDELNALRSLEESPQRPFWVILGGAKVSDKIGVIESLQSRVDGFIIGGGMANTFLAAQGVDVGASRVEENAIGLARDLLAAHPGIWELPIDGRVAPAIDSTAAEEWSVGEPLGERMILDIGPRTAKAFTDRLAEAKTIFWNGPPGVFEKEPFRGGTEQLAAACASHGGTVVIGGGDTAAAARQFQIDSSVTHVCTGGGAALEFLEGKTLPGLAALEAAAERDRARDPRETDG